MVIAHMSSNQKLRHAIRYVLKMDGISVRDLASRTGKKSHTHTSRMLSGAVPDPGLDEWDRIAKACNTTVSELLQMPNDVILGNKDNRETIKLLPRLPKKSRKMARTA